jgi:hypothetical protein
MNNNFFYLLIAFLLLIYLPIAQGQDTLTVEPFTQDGELNLVRTILGDTSENGQRANLQRVYRLKRGAIYLMDQTIFADFPIRMVSENDPSKRPAMLVRGKFATGDPIKTFFTFTKDGLEHSFSDIIFNGVDEERQYMTQWNRGLKISGSNISLTLQKCIMNAWAGLFLEITGDDASLYIRDSKWRNGVGSQAPPWGAQQTVFFAKYIKNLIVTNNTFFNTGGFWLFQEDGIAENVIVEHNTLFTSAIDLHRMRDLVNAKFRSNIYYGTHAYGQSPSELAAAWFDKDKQVISMFSIDTTGSDLLKSKSLKESDKKITCSHNVYFSPKIMTDWWSANPTLNKPIWMHSRTQNMFNDNSTYPYLVEMENSNQNPNFVDTQMENWVVTELIKYCDNTRKSKPLSNRNYDVFKGIQDVLMVPWPLPENLVYTNAEMLVGGHDGLPVGDLNWYPDQRKLYQETMVNVSDTGIAENLDMIQSITPNPSNDRILVAFNDDIFKKESDILIINSEGKTIWRSSINLNSTFEPIHIDITSFNAGVYYLRVETKNGTETKKFVKL